MPRLTLQANDARSVFVTSESFHPCKSFYDAVVRGLRVPSPSVALSLKRRQTLSAVASTRNSPCPPRRQKNLSFLRMCFCLLQHNDVNAEHTAFPAASLLTVAATGCTDGGDWERKAEATSLKISRDFVEFVVDLMHEIVRAVTTEVGVFCVSENGPTGGLVEPP